MRVCALSKIFPERSIITELTSYPIIPRTRPSADHPARRVVESGLNTLLNRPVSLRGALKRRIGFARQVQAGLGSSPEELNPLDSVRSGRRSAKRSTRGCLVSAPWGAGRFRLDCRATMGFRRTAHGAIPPYPRLRQTVPDIPGAARPRGNLPQRLGCERVRLKTGEYSPANLPHNGRGAPEYPPVSMAFRRSAPTDPKRS